MTDDYISRQAAIDALDKEYRYGADIDRCGLATALDEIEDIPAADVAPVAHGKWIPHREKSREYIGTILVHVRYDYWLCDTCGYRVKNGQPIYNFCPNCGARMIYGKREE